MNAYHTTASATARTKFFEFMVLLKMNVDLSSPSLRPQRRSFGRARPPSLSASPHLCEEHRVVLSVELGAFGTGCVEKIHLLRRLAPRFHERIHFTDPLFHIAVRTFEHLCEEGSRDAHHLGAGDIPADRDKNIRAPEGVFVGEQEGFGGERARILDAPHVLYHHASEIQGDVQETPNPVLQKQPVREHDLACVPRSGVEPGAAPRFRTFVERLHSNSIPKTGVW